MQKKISQLFPVVLLISISLVLRLLALQNLNGLESEFKQPFILQLLSFSLPVSKYVFLFLSCISGYLFYEIGKLKNQTVGLLALGIYAISPWFIYSDISLSIYSIAVLAVLFTILGYLKRDQLNGFRMLLLGGILLSYSILFGALFYVAVLFKSYKDDKNKLLSGLIPILPLFCLGLYNYEGLVNVFRQNVNIFSEIGTINSVNTFQGNLNQSGWGVFGKLVLNKFSYYFLLLIDSGLRIISPVTYFTAERKLFEFSNIPPLSVLFVLPLLLVAKKKVTSLNKKIYLLFFTFGLLIITPLLSIERYQLEKLLLISPFIVLLIAFGITELVHLKSKKYLIFFVIVFLLFSILTFVNVNLYEQTRLELLQK